jgi:acid phosphatase (class B)
MSKIINPHVDGRITFALLALFILVGFGTVGCRTVSFSDPIAPENFLSIEQVASMEGVNRAGFDVDDTLLFSTGAFRKGFESGHEYGSEAFWALVNGSDRENSVVKKAARTVVERYRARGIEIFAITARSPFGGIELAKYLNEMLGIPVENVFFEPVAKADRIRAVRLDVFFGDSDTDIKDAMEAGVRAIRFQRSGKSSYKNKDGSLRKYHPGMYGEQIIRDSEE